MAFEFGKRVLRGGVLGVALALAAALARHVRRVHAHGKDGRMLFA